MVGARRAKSRGRSGKKLIDFLSKDYWEEVRKCERCAENIKRGRTSKPQGTCPRGEYLDRFDVAFISMAQRYITLLADIQLGRDTRDLSLSEFDWRIFRLIEGIRLKRIEDAQKRELAKMQKKR